MGAKRRNALSEATPPTGGTDPDDFGSCTQVHGPGVTLRALKYRVDARLPSEPSNTEVRRKEYGLALQVQHYVKTPAKPEEPFMH